jgi:hypothetical protein
MLKVVKAKAEKLKAETLKCPESSRQRLKS